MESAAGSGAGLQGAAGRQGTLAHADQAVSGAAGVGSGGAEAGSGVRDVDRQAVGAVVEPHGGGRGPGVAQGVGQRLLDDAIRGQLDVTGSLRFAPSTSTVTGNPAER